MRASPWSWTSSTSSSGWYKSSACNNGGSRRCEYQTNPDELSSWKTWVFWQNWPQFYNSPLFNCNKLCKYKYQTIPITPLFQQLILACDTLWLHFLQVLLIGMIEFIFCAVNGSLQIAMRDYATYYCPSLPSVTNVFFKRMLKDIDLVNFPCYSIIGGCEGRAIRLFQPQCLLEGLIRGSKLDGRIFII